MLQKYLPVFLIFLFGVLGCASTETIESTKVSATEIYQSYVIQGNKNSTSVNATFRVGGPTGSTVDLDAPAKIEHNDKEMTESAPGFMKGTDYYDSSSQFVSNHKLKFTDASGKVWENEISFDVLEITSQNLSFSKANGGSFTLSRPLGKDETIEISLTSEKNPPPPSNNGNSGNKTSDLNYGISLHPTFDQAGTTAKIDVSELKNFVDGKANMQVTIRKNKGAEQSAKGGSLDFTYEAQKVSVNVVN